MEHFQASCLLNHVLKHRFNILDQPETFSINTEHTGLSGFSLNEHVCVSVNNSMEMIIRYNSLIDKLSN